MCLAIRIFLPCLLVYVIAFQLTYSQFVSKSSEHSAHLHRNDTVSQLFWQSISQIEADTDAKFKSIAERIATIRNFELNQRASVCYQAIENTFRRGASEEWAAKLINSNSFIKEDIVSSLITEQFTSLGDFETCLSVSDISTKINNATVTFSGRYCLASLGTPSIDSRYQKQTSPGNVSASTFKLATKWLGVHNRFPLVQAICFPSICTEPDLVSLMHQYFPNYLKGIKLTIGYCQQHEPPFSGNHFTGSQIIAILILGFFTFLSTLGTALYWVIKWCKLKDYQHLVSIASCFDLYRNVNSLFSVKSEKQQSYEHNLRFIYGLKAWMILFVVLVHSFCFISSLLFSKVSLFTHYPSFYLHFPQQVGFLYNVIGRGFLLIDFFFIISGFLVTHLMIRQGPQVPNFVFSIFARWFRFVPSVIGILCLTIALQALGSGPLFHKQLTDPYVQPCVDYWWTHVLFINNWYTLDQMCGASLWFVSADFQLNILLYLVLFAYFHKKLYAYLTSFALITISFGTLAFFVAFGILGIPRGDYPLQYDFPAPLEAIRLFYTSPLFHTFAYLMGAFIAFRLVKKKRKPAVSKYTDILLITCMLVIFLAVLCPLPNGLLSRANENSNFLHFLLFTLSYIVIVLAATFAFYLLLLTNKGSLFKRLFSAHFTLPLGRLSYGIYLANPLLIWYNTQQSQQTPSLTVLYTLQFFSVIYTQSLLLSIFLYIFFESPFSNLFRLLTKHLLAKQNKQVKSRLNSEQNEGNANELKMNI